jgi:flagellar protein FliO/FliZ
MYPTRRGPLAITALLLAIALCHSAEEARAAAGIAASSDMEGYFRLIWGLLVVLGILLLLYGLLKKRFSLLGNDGRREIQVVEIRPLMGKKALCLVTVKGQEFLLGLSGDQITHLATIRKGDETSFPAILKKTEAGSP